MTVRAVMVRAAMEKNLMTPRFVALAMEKKKRMFERGECFAW